MGEIIWPDGPVEGEEDEYDTWAGFPRMWYAPLDWIDYTQSKFFTNDYQL